MSWRREDARGVLAVVGEEVDGDHHLVGEAVVAGLAALAADDVDDLVGALDERVAEAEEALAALLDRQHTPRRLRLLRATDGGEHLVPRRHADLAEELAAWPAPSS